MKEDKSKSEKRTDIRKQEYYYGRQNLSRE